MGQSFQDGEEETEKKFQGEQKAYFKYFQNCNEQQSLALHLFKKIIGKKLILIDYKLNYGVCKALSKGFEGKPTLLD